MESEANIISVRITKRRFDGLGFLIQRRNTNPSVVISELIQGGVAEQTGLIRVGDNIVSVNGVNLRDVPYTTAVEVLRSVPVGASCLLVLRGPEGYHTRLETLHTATGVVRIVRISEPIEKATHASGHDDPSDQYPGTAFYQLPTEVLANPQMSRIIQNYDVFSTLPPPLSSYSNAVDDNESLAPSDYSPLETREGRVISNGSSQFRYNSPRSHSHDRTDDSPLHRLPKHEQVGSPVRRRTTLQDTYLAWNGSSDSGAVEFGEPRPYINSSNNFYKGIEKVGKNNNLSNGGPHLADNTSIGVQCPERVIYANLMTDVNSQVDSEGLDYHNDAMTPSVYADPFQVGVQSTSPNDITPAPIADDVRVPVSAADQIKSQLTTTQLQDDSPASSDLGYDSNSDVIKTGINGRSKVNPPTTKEDRQTIESDEDDEPASTIEHADTGSKVETTEHGESVDSMRNQAEQYKPSKDISPKVTDDGIGPTKDSKPTTGDKSGIMHQRKSKFVRLKNFMTGNENSDILHSKTSLFNHCDDQHCQGSIMFKPADRATGELRPKEELLTQAKDFINQYYTHIKRLNTEAHGKRTQEVVDAIEKTGTYHLTETELIFGTKTAWRNAPRCIGRIQWSKLQVFDARNIMTATQMFEVLCNHIKYATNKGNIRAAITIFPHRTDGYHDFRVWNSQLIQYAAYRQPDDSVIGDPANLEFTEICEKLGWKGPGGQFDILPLVLQADGQDPEIFEIPRELVLEVQLSHPKFDWFADLGLRWFALPAVANMLFDCGGLEFTACPFSGWYMGTEIGARDLCDKARYNVMETVASKMGLDITSTSSLWKDRTLVEVNIAVLHSFQLHKVTITDHHQASDSFIKHMHNEQRLRGGCPADWVWIVPPMSGSVTSVFHQEMVYYRLKPSYEYQENPWKNYKWDKSGDEKSKRRKATFKEVAAAVRFSAAMMGKAMGKRIKATILYGSETGKSESYAKILYQIFNHAFNVKVKSMDEYDVTHLEHEALVMVVTSTFGNGDPPENGESFAKYLMDLHQLSNPAVKGKDRKKLARIDTYLRLLKGAGTTGALSSTETAHDSDLLRNIGELSNQLIMSSRYRFSVFALGSRAYPNFCAFGHAIDSLFSELGGERILEIGEGDELCGQDESFRAWAQNVFQAACDTFCVGEGVNFKKASGVLTSGDQTWQQERFRVVKVNDDVHGQDLCQSLSKLHGRSVSPCKLIDRTNLQALESSRSTILVRVDTQSSNELHYQPGDHVAFFPANSEGLVDSVINQLQCETISPDDVLCVQYLEESTTPFGKNKVWTSTERLSPCTIRTALRYYLDITTPPSPQFLQKLVKMCEDDRERNTVELLAKGADEYEDWKFDHVPTLPEVLDSFPSIKLSPSFLLSQLPLMKPRYYSISSSPEMHPGEIHATVAVVQYQTLSGKLHNGVCSSWLNHINGADVIPCFVRPAPSFHMPKESITPIILVGPGSGIAPFRSFWQQRYIDIQQAEIANVANKFGDITLVFGCRQSNVDNIYKDELQHNRKLGVLSSVMMAFSREPGKPKQYVQDILIQYKQDVSETLVDKGGHFYVCGDVSMATSVCEVIKSILQTTRAMNALEAKQYVNKMKDENRYHEDIFGVTLRTAEVTREKRQLERKRTMGKISLDNKEIKPLRMANDKTDGTDQIIT
ncbi:nitric oxide synthase, salivary gland-like [Glandiceps talaboti]